MTLFGLLANIPASRYVDERNTERPHLVGQVPEVDAEPFGHPGDELAFQISPRSPQPSRPLPRERW